MNRTKYLHDMTGRVITSRTVALCDPYSGDWITEAIVSKFECSPDDVGTVETDEGERITARGEVIGYISVG